MQDDAVKTPETPRVMNARRLPRIEDIPSDAKTHPCRAFIDRITHLEGALREAENSREDWRRIAEGSDNYVRTVADKLRARVVALEAALRAAQEWARQHSEDRLMFMLNDALLSPSEAI